MTLTGVDTGGTFTDVVEWDGREVRTFKVLSGPDALREGLRRAGGGEVVVGTTVATNALLERKGARVAMLTTAGFEDLIEIGRQARGKLYDLGWDRPEPLVPRERRFGVRERIAADGSVVTPLGEVPKPDADVVAVCFLHSHKNPAHERVAARRVGGAVCSSDVAPEYREYERFATTLAHAYVGPVMRRYVEGLRDVAPNVSIVSGNGGTLTADGACERPVETILSGPAAGVHATAELARLLGRRRVISLDMGGTSTDISVIDGEPRITKDLVLGGVPLRVPLIEILSIGAGGGSIVRLDEGGALRVGPESAGATPGPACYGRGGKRFTLTDAHVLVGRIPTDAPFAGGLRLDRRLAEAVAISAEGAIDVANAAMERAIKVVSVERGCDPADFDLVAFGGMGPLHACDLVERLGLRSAIVPPEPGCFSALGAVMTDFVRERWRSGVAFDEIEREIGRGTRYVEARYKGQSYEIIMPWEGFSKARFDEAHRARYEHACDDEVEIVASGVRVVTPRPNRAAFQRVKGGSIVKGPAVIPGPTATIWVAPGFRAVPGEFGEVLLERL